MSLVPSVAAEPIDLDASESEKQDDGDSEKQDDGAYSDGLSDPTEFDSPPHRGQKLEKIWARERVAVNALCKT